MATFQIIKLWSSFRPLSKTELEYTEFDQNKGYKRTQMLELHIILLLDGVKHSWIGR